MAASAAAMNSASSMDDWIEDDGVLMRTISKQKEDEIDFVNYGAYWLKMIKPKRSDSNWDEEDDDECLLTKLRMFEPYDDVDDEELEIDYKEQWLNMIKAKEDISVDSGENDDDDVYWTVESKIKKLAETPGDEVDTTRYKALWKNMVTMKEDEYSDEECPLIRRGSDTPVEDKNGDVKYDDLWLRMISSTSVE